MSAPRLKKCRGLYTASNRYDVPEGALITANNIMIFKDGVIQPRYGLVAYSTTMTLGNVSAWHRAAELNGTLWFGGRDTVANTLKIGYGAIPFAGTTLAQTEDGPDGYASFTGSTTPYYDMEFLKLGNLLYYNCARGMVRIESTSTQRLAGNYPCAVSCTPRLISITSATRTSNVTAVTTAHAHGFVAGMKVYVPDLAGSVTVLGSDGTNTPTGTTFKYADPGVNGAVAITTCGAANFLAVGTGFMATNDRVAYRAVLTEYDTNGYQYVGAPSSRIVVTNASPFLAASNNANVQVAVLFPAGVLAANTKVELYRSHNAPSTEPDDELFQVYSKFLNTAEIAQGYCWISDITPDSSTGVGKALYSNETEQGQGQANTRPAGAKTAAIWRDRVVQANTFDNAQINMQLLSVDSSSGGLASTDLFCLDWANYTTTTYTACNSGTAITSQYQFTRYSGGTANVDVQHTVLSLIDTINWGYGASSVSPLVTYLAQYTSGPTGWLGHFNISLIAADQNEATSTTSKKRMITTGNNTGKAAAVTRDCWAPKLGQIMLPSTTVRTNDSVVVTFFDDHSFNVGEYVVVYSSWTNQTQLVLGPNGIEGKITSTTHNTITFTNTNTGGSTTYNGSGAACAVKYGPLLENNHQVANLRASKPALPGFPAQPEAFPAFNNIVIGSPSRKILKCVPCRDSLMVFKEDGLFRVTSSGAYGENLNAELVDPNAILWAKDTAVPLSGGVIAWLTKGVAILNEQGVQKYISKGRIDDRLAPTTTQTAEPDLLAYPYAQRAQAFVDEKRNLYELRVCLSSGPSAPYSSTVNLTYNIDNDTWVEDDLTVTSEVFYQGKRYIAQASTLYAQDNQVYAGAGTGVLSGFGTTFTDSTFSFTYTGSVSVGSVIEDLDTPGNFYYVVTASAGSGTLYSPYTNGVPSVPLTYNIYSPVVSTIEWAPVTFGEENKLKRHREIEVLFGVREQLAAELTTHSELITTTETNVVKMGTVPTSVGVNGFSPYNLRMVIPQQHRVGQQLNAKLVIRTAYGSWTILGVGVDADILKTRINR